MYDFGSPWVMGDGASPLNLDDQRPIDRDYKLSWYEQYAEVSHHWAGLVFANFYWRLRQTNVASLDRLMALSMKAFKLTVKGADGRSRSADGRFRTARAIVRGRNLIRMQLLRAQRLLRFLEGIGDGPMIRTDTCTSRSTPPCGW